MHFSEYQKESRKTARYANVGKNYLYPLLGLLGEAGEVSEKFKRTMRDGKTLDEVRGDAKKEMGDVLWYLAQLATEMDLSLEDIASHNLEKLFSRVERGKIQGEGDDR